MSEGNVRVRFAPSPTGYPHVGNIRTALFNWLFARHCGGSFIVRIEDTDVTRKVRGALEAMLESLRWLGLDWDEGPEVGGDYAPYVQSERRDLYQKCAQQLLEGGHAYKCYCSSERLSQMRAEMAERKESMRTYDRCCRDLTQEERDKLEAQDITPVVRFKTPLEGTTSFNDLIKGDVTFDNCTLDDFILLKSDGYPTYHLANIVDDHLMQISHVLRADEWLSSTPRHILLYQALRYEPPEFAHLPMILGPDRAKLSKRHGATSIIEYRDRGYLPEAMVNFLALLGWALDDKTEIFSKEELFQYFSIGRISKTSAIFNKDKLDWMNGVYIRNMSIAELTEQLLPFLERDLPEEVKRPISKEYVQQIAPLIQERLTRFGEAAELCKFYFIEPVPQTILPTDISSEEKFGMPTIYPGDKLVYDAKLLLGKNLTKEAAMAGLEAALRQLQDVPFDASSLDLELRFLAGELGLKTGDFFGLLRIAVTGRTAAPPLFQTMAVLGRERCLRRIEAALGKLGLV
ncbi:Glutamate--tRNA ligase [subsurface metagenome]